MTSRLRVSQPVTKQNLTKAFGTFEHKMDRRFDRVESSIDKLAVAVQQGFEAMEQKFEGVDRRFETMELKLEGKIDSVRDELKGDIKRIDNRLVFMQDKVDAHDLALSKFAPA